MRNPIVSLRILRIYILADKTDRADVGRRSPGVEQKRRGPILSASFSGGKKGQEHLGFRPGGEATLLGILRTPPFSFPAAPENPGVKGQHPPRLPLLTFLILDLEAG